MIDLVAKACPVLGQIFSHVVWQIDNKIANNQWILWSVQVHFFPVFHWNQLSSKEGNCRSEKTPRRFLQVLNINILNCFVLPCWNGSFCKQPISQVRVLAFCARVDGGHVDIHLVIFKRVSNKMLGLGPLINWDKLVTLSRWFRYDWYPNLWQENEFFLHSKSWDSRVMQNT